MIKHELPVVKEETERCDTLRYLYQKLNAQCAEVQTYLLSIQPSFKSELIKNVQVFIQDCSEFYDSYDKVRLNRIRTNFKTYKLCLKSLLKTILFGNAVIFSC